MPRLSTLRPTVRPGLRTAGVLAAVCALVAAPATPAGAAAPAASAVPTAAAEPGLGLTTLGLGGWRVRSSGGVPQPGQQVSTPGFPTSGWLDVRPDDAGAPGTELEALLQNGVCPHDPAFAINQLPRMNDHHVFFSDNLRRCYGLQTAIGPDTIPEFSVPWWFRTDFTPNLRAGQAARLVVNGVVGQADVWVNGTEVGTQATVAGAFTSHSFDVTNLVRPGTNSLALELYPNNPTSMLTLDSVDWSQIPPDNNTGIQFPVQLHVARALAVDDAHVTQNDAPDLSSSALTVRADVTNTTPVSRTGVATAVITPPGGGAPLRVSQAVAVPPGTSRTVTFAPSDFPALTIRHPRVWWPYQMGGQPLYTLSTSVAEGGAVSDTAPDVTFGIRLVTTSLTAPSAMAPQGVRVFQVNGRPFVFRAGGFTEDLFLHYSAPDLANQLALIRGLGLNGIRTEGKEVPGDFYEQMDRAGVLVDAGFQCCDSWQPDSGGAGVTAQDFRVMELSALAIGRRLRDHPSIMSFSWSDSPPIPRQETVSLAGFAQAGFQEPIVSSAEYLRSGALGPAGEKEGPYDWVPPAYWYDTTHASHNALDSDPAMTNVGGSWGFDSEQSAGHTVPTSDSIRRFLSPAEQAALWQQPAAHQYHTNFESTAGEHVGYTFGTLFNLDQAMTNRYGAWSGLDQYVQEAQVQNYEDTRAQFEAFVDHWNNLPTPSTGTVYWQLNKGWPSLLWELYNNDYDLAGSYFGARKANETLHVLYAYDTGAVTVDNLSGVTQPDVSVESRVHALDGRLLDDQGAAGVTLPSQGVRNAVITPRLPAATAPPAPAQAYFVELVLRQRGAVVDRNVYWLSTQSDVVDWTSTQGNPQALTGPATSGLPRYADLRALRGLGQAPVRAAASTDSQGDTTTTRVTLTNPAAAPGVAFFVRADVRRGAEARPAQPGDDQVLPIAWSDNDVTLWPGQSTTLTATYRTSLLDGAAPVVSVGGWNTPALTVPAAATPAAVAAQRAAGAEAGVEHLGAADGSPMVSGSATPGAGPNPPPRAGGTPPRSGVAWTISSLPRTRFAQGDEADSYTLTVTDSGTAATDGSTPVTLTDVVDPDARLRSISGPGWTCDTAGDPTEVCRQTGGPGGRPAVLAPGQSYPPLTLTVSVPPGAGFGTQDSTAGLHLTNGVSVTGGAPSRPGAAIAPETPLAGRPDLTADDAVDGAFRQGDPADRYRITVINQGGGPTAGRNDTPIVATVAVPAGETPVALYGSGWTCSLASVTCRRSDALPGESAEEPPIVLAVAVSPDAPASLTQSVTVSGGGERAPAATVQAQTTILTAASGPPPPPGPLTVSSAHAGVFAQGDGADRYVLTVRNAGDRPSQGPVTVTDTLPAGLSATRLSGDGWSCSLQAAALPAIPNTFEPLVTCARADPLGAGASYPPIGLTVAVEGDARPSLANSVTVSGGGPKPASATAADPTEIVQRADLRVTALPTAGGVPYAPFVRGAGAAERDAYSITVANVGFAATNGPVALSVDLPAGMTALSMSAGPGWSCAAAVATCATRPGAVLAAGARADVTLQVAVASGAPASVLPSIRVAGGGEIDRSGDVTVPPTAIADRPPDG
jgi:exo-1,4-beta-D-glucosaminidase